MIRKYQFGNFRLQLSLNRVNRMKSLTVFNYHQIGKTFNPLEHTGGTFTQSDFFEAQILWLKKNFKIVKLSEGLEAADHNRLEGECAAISFDDGDKSCKEVMEILRRHEVPATFFINSAYLDNQNSFWFNIYNFIKHNQTYAHLLTSEIEAAIRQLRHTVDREFYNTYRVKIESLFDAVKEDFDMYLTYADLEAMDGRLFDVALHGHEHQRFSMMSLAWQRESLCKNIEALSGLKNYKPIFAIPFGRSGDWNKETIQAALEHGLDIVFADGGINREKDVGYKRIPADSRVLKALV